MEKGTQVFFVIEMGHLLYDMLAIHSPKYSFTVTQSFSTTAQMKNEKWNVNQYSLEKLAYSPNFNSQYDFLGMIIFLWVFGVILFCYMWNIVSPKNHMLK